MVGDGHYWLHLRSQWPTLAQVGRSRSRQRTAEIGFLAVFPVTFAPLSQWRGTDYDKNRFNCQCFAHGAIAAPDTLLVLVWYQPHFPFR